MLYLNFAGEVTHFPSHAPKRIRQYKRPTLLPSPPPFSSKRYFIAPKALQMFLK
jgi:hypothetical protein